MWRKTVREKGHLSQTVVMAASSEQANAWRPGREEAVKAMGLVRGMVSSVNQAPSWGPEKCRAGRRREEETRRKLETHRSMAWRHAATVEVAIETAVRAQDGHPAQSLSSGRGHELGRRARNGAPRWSTTSLAVPGHAQEWSEPRSRPSYGHMMSTGRPHVAQREVSLPEAGSVRSRVGGPPRRSTCRDKGKRARNGGGPGSGAPAPGARDGRQLVYSRGKPSTCTKGHPFTV